MGRRRQFRHADFRVSDLVEFRDAGCLRYGEVANLSDKKVYVCPLQEREDDTYCYSSTLWLVDLKSITRTARTIDGLMIVEGWHHLGFLFHSFQDIVRLESLPDSNEEGEESDEIENYN